MDSIKLLTNHFECIFDNWNLENFFVNHKYELNNILWNIKFDKSIIVTRIRESTMSIQIDSQKWDVPFKIVLNQLKEKCSQCTPETIKICKEIAQYLLNNGATLNDPMVNKPVLTV